LILFEEAGGNPNKVSFQTIGVGTICGTVLEKNTLNLACQGVSQISKIEFASFGNPEGTCQAFKKGSCESPDAMNKITEVISSYSIQIRVFLVYDQDIICFLLFFRNVLDKHRARLLQTRACSATAVVNAEMLSRNSQCKQSVVSALFENQ